MTRRTRIHGGRAGIILVDATYPSPYLDAISRDLRVTQVCSVEELRSLRANPADTVLIVSDPSDGASIQAFLTARGRWDCVAEFRPWFTTFQRLGPVAIDVVLLLAAGVTASVDLERKLHVTRGHIDRVFGQLFRTLGCRNRADLAALVATLFDVVRTEELARRLRERDQS